MHPIDVGPEVEAGDNLVVGKEHANWVIEGCASSNNLSVVFIKLCVNLVNIAIYSACVYP